jgi:Beta-galactosidase
MSKVWLPAVVLLMVLQPFSFSSAQASSVVVFSEAAFPSADSSVPSRSQISAALPNAKFVNAQELGEALSFPESHLLVLPFGSAFPEATWPHIQRFLGRGGNLLVIGGRPFTRSAFHDNTGWHLRDYSVRFARALMIDQYQSTPGSQGLNFQLNPDLLVQIPQFAWNSAYSPVIRLSAVDLYHRGGAAGSIDARVDPMVWGIKNGRKMSAPVIEIDHVRNGFDGGRWIFVAADLPSNFWSAPEAAQLLGRLAERASQGSEEFIVRPIAPLYLPGEPIQLQVTWHSMQPSSPDTKVRVAVYREDRSSPRSEIVADVRAIEPIVVPAPAGKGMYVVDAQLVEGEKVRANYHSGFWVRDESYLHSGLRLSVSKDYFERDGKAFAVVGTTYMSGEAQRLYFEYPNVYLWNQELGEIHAAGLNMIRSGWWTGWDKFCNENGEPYERTLLTLEAFLMTARKNGLPVQFNFFAFLPDVLGGVNPYLDPEAVRRQRTLISSVVARFHDVPFLVWDLINEPSISQHLWTMRPNGDPIELEKWNEWLNQRYPDRAALAAAWNLPLSEIQGTIPLPEEMEFTQRGAYVGRNALKVYDFYAFAQDVFLNWVKTMRDAIRASGSQQLITVGQDEGGIQDRLSPAYWGKYVDFTTNHSWWQNDYLLWDSLLAKQPGQAMLIQETGLQRELDLDEIARRDPEHEASLLERKVATSFLQGAGAIEWLWNTNSYMTESNETPIGLIRPDGTEKPEATVMRSYAAFAPLLDEHLENPQQPAIALITSQAAQFSVLGDLQLEAQRNAVRALAYHDRLTLYAVAENQIARLGSPKLAILPSPQALAEPAWKALLQYVSEGGNLLITGPVDRDEHWHRLARSRELKLGAEVEPLMFHNAAITVNGRSIPVSFDQQKQNLVETLRFTDGSSFKEISFGKGRVFWAAYPLEMAVGTDAAAALYSYVAGRVGITPLFDVQSTLSPGMLIFPTVLEDSVLYIISSETAEDSQIDIRDRLTGARLQLRLAAQHAALAVISKKTKAVVAKYGF